MHSSRLGVVSFPISVDDRSRYLYGIPIGDNYCIR